MQLYLERYTDVAAAGYAPLAHYLTHGVREDRASFPVPQPPGPRSASIATENDLSGTITESDTVSIYQALKERISARRQKLKDAVSVAPLELLDFKDAVKHISSLALPRFATPRVSILIPAYNEAKYTAECIGSIVASAPKVSYEVIIADDASPEASARALGDIINVKFVRQPTNQGFLKNCNGSFRHCAGEYLLLLNNDAQLSPGALDALVGSSMEIHVLQRWSENSLPRWSLAGGWMHYKQGRVSTMVGLFAEPAALAFNHNRQVEYLRCGIIGSQ